MTMRIGQSRGRVCGGDHRKNSFIHSMTTQPTYNMPDGCDCAWADPSRVAGDEDQRRGGGIRGTSDEPSFVLESEFVAKSFVARSCTPGCTQCSNTRMFVMARGGRQESDPCTGQGHFIVDAQALF